MIYRSLSVSITFFLFLSSSTAMTADVFAQIAEKMPVHKRLNVAHRGASHLAPENTLMAYRISVTAGATGAECDVYRSKDGALFLAHDGTTKRTMGGGDRKVTDLTFAELRKLDAGAWKGKQFKGEPVPTLDEYLELLKDTTCHPVVEIKMDGIEKPVLDSIRKAGMLEVTTIIAFSKNVVKEIRKQEPNICVAWLHSENLKDKGSAEENADRMFEFYMNACKELDTKVLDLGHGVLSEKLIKKLQAAGIHVWCWTVNDVARMNQLLDWGIESITTDRPELLTEVLKTRKMK